MTHIGDKDDDCSVTLSSVDIACPGQISRVPGLRNMAGSYLLRYAIAQTSITADEDAKYGNCGQC